MDTSNITSTKAATGGSGDKVYGPSSPYIFFQPANLFMFMSNFSPIIVAIFILAVSFCAPTPNFKGLVYLGFLVGSTVIRNYAYQASDLMPIVNNPCNFIRYSKFCNTTFSIFVLSFTITYLSIPMFQRNSINIAIFSMLLFYLFIDVGSKMMRGCININIDMPYLLLDLCLGASFAAVFVMLMELGGSDKYLFFSNLQNNAVVCSRPKSQTLKCAVYKNGQLVS